MIANVSERFINVGAKPWTRCYHRKEEGTITFRDGKPRTSGSNLVLDESDHRNPTLRTSFVRLRWLHPAPSAPPGRTPIRSNLLLFPRPYVLDTQKRIWYHSSSANLWGPWSPSNLRQGGWRRGRRGPGEGEGGAGGGVHLLVGIGYHTICSPRNRGAYWEGCKPLEAHRIHPTVFFFVAFDFF